MAEPYEVMPDAIEEERYELFQAPLYRFDQSRRSFLKLMGAGMAILLVARDVLAQESGSGGAPSSMDTDRIGAWLHIGPEGAVTVCTGKVEVGQNIRTSLAQAVADELHLTLGRITMIMGDTDLVPFDRGTFGSRSTPAMAPQLRRAGVAAREWILDLGAESLAVDRTELQTIDGRVVHARSGRSLGYGELTQGRQLSRTIDASTALTAAEHWTVAGRSAPKVNGRDFVTGTHRYPSDITRPGMLVGRVLRPPSFGAELVALDDSQARGLPGVAVVRDGSFVGVTAPSEHMADRAPAALSAKWRESASPVSSATCSNTCGRRPSPTTCTPTRALSTTLWQVPLTCTPRRTTSISSPTRHSSRAQPSPNGRLAQSRSGRERSVPSVYVRSSHGPSTFRKNRST